MNRRPSQSRSGYDSFSSRHTAHFTASSPDGSFFEPRRRRPLAPRLLALAAALAALLLLVNFGVNRFVHVNRLTVPMRGLGEAFEGYTILHVSDLKGARFGSNQEGIALALRGEHFDAVALTGDMVSAMGNAQPLYALIDVLRELNPSAPIYFIPGDDDPEPLSMDYADSGSPFAPWVLGARQRGAQLLSSPQGLNRDGQTLWLTTSSLLSLDLDAAQSPFELRYLDAQASGDENAIELAAYNLNALEQTRTARKAMQEEDVIVSLTHVPPAAQELEAAAGTLAGRVGLVLCGHYLGGLIRLPGIGPMFVPSQQLERYGLFPGASACSGLSRRGSAWVHISTGLGDNDGHYPAPFFRLFNPPSVSLVTLTPSSL